MARAAPHAADRRRVLVPSSVSKRCQEDFWGTPKIFLTPFTWPSNLAPTSPFHMPIPGPQTRITTQRVQHPLGQQETNKGMARLGDAPRPIRFARITTPRRDPEVVGQAAGMLESFDRPDVRQQSRRRVLADLGQRPQAADLTLDPFRTNVDPVSYFTDLLGGCPILRPRRRVGDG